MVNGKCANDEQYQTIIRDTDDDPLFDQGLARLKSYCHDCPVKFECRMHGLSNREPYGIWGGTTPKERSHKLSRLERDLQRLLPQMPVQLRDGTEDPNGQGLPSAESH